MNRQGKSDVGLPDTHYNGGQVADTWSRMPPTYQTVNKMTVSLALTLVYEP